MNVGQAITEALEEQGRSDYARVVGEAGFRGLVVMSDGRVASPYDPRLYFEIRQ